MDKIAVISDIHGNLPALETVLKDIKRRNIDRIICLGDLAGKGPSSAEVVDLIKETCETVIKGNWDHFMANKDTDSSVLIWHQNLLGETRMNYLDKLPIYNEFYMSGKLIRLCHTSPNDLFHRTYLFTEKEERLRLFKPTRTLDVHADVVGYGDIHSAHIDNFDCKTLFNVGSVGNPLEIPQASYGVLEGVYNSKEDSSFTISLVRVPYDIELSIKHAHESGMPDLEAYIKELKTAEYRGR